MSEILCDRSDKRCPFYHNGECWRGLEMPLVGVCPAENKKREKKEKKMREKDMEILKKLTPVQPYEKIYRGVKRTYVPLIIDEKRRGVPLCDITNLGIYLDVVVDVKTIPPCIARRLDCVLYVKGHNSYLPSYYQKVDIKIGSAVFRFKVNELPARNDMLQRYWPQIVKS